MLMTANVLLIVTDILLIMLEVLLLKGMRTKKAESEENGMYDVEMVSDSVREKIARIETRIEKEVGVGCSQEELAQMRAETRRRKKREEER